MKILLYLPLLICTQALADWKQPQVLCPEEIIPQGLPCLDLSRVANPLNDFPAELSQADKGKWANEWSSDLKVCRHLELLKREEAKPGTYRPLQIQIAWMITNGAEKPQEKLSAVMNAANKYQIPPQILLGAITQESLLSSLGISPDGGNYSCGIAQLNIQEWCESLANQPASEKEKIGWPQISCSHLTSAMLSPFYKIAKLKLGPRPEYRINATDFTGITLAQVKTQFPAASEALQATRFKAINSFINHCQGFGLSISAKALILRNLFQNFVPIELKSAEIYPSGESFKRNCETAYSSKYYPLHTGWLLAVAIYNAGPRQSKLIEHYYQAKEKLPTLNPVDLIEALHWGGKNREGTSKIYFQGRNGKTYSQSWYKSCVVQRHVSRVIQHVSLPGRPIARSLELAPCSPDGVPEYRKISSGVKTSR